MLLTPKQVVERETAKFLDTCFRQLDLSGCPSCLTPPSDDAELPDSKFATLDNRGPGFGAAALKRGIEELAKDPVVQEQIARETGDPDLLADYQQHQAEQVAREVRRLNSSYYRSPENWKLLVRCLAFNCLGWEPDEGTSDEAQEELIKRGLWTLPNLTAAFKALSREGTLETDPNQPRPLSEQQRRSIALQASTGDVEGAISTYLQWRLPEDAAYTVAEAFYPEDVLDAIADPQYNKVVEERCGSAGNSGD